MTAATYSRRLASPELRALIARRFAECGALLLALGAVGLLVALASYHPLDPSRNVATAGPTHNLLGPPGAFISNALLQWFGVAGALPALAMLAWAWRISANRRHDLAGSGAALRAIGLLLAMPVLAAVLAGLPGPHGQTLLWPVAAGPGGAVGIMLADGAGGVGRGLFGAHGGWVIGALGAALALVLALLTLGLTLGEWRAAARGLRRALAWVRRAAAATARLMARLAAAGAWVIHKVNGTRPGARPDARSAASQEDEAPAPRHASSLSVPRAASRAETLPESPVAAAPASRPLRRLAGKPEKAPMEEVGWRFPPIDLLAKAPGRAGSGALSREALEATGRMLESVLADYGVQGRIVDHQPGPGGHAV